MWLSLFSITFAIALALAVAATILQEQEESGPFRGAARLRGAARR